MGELASVYTFDFTPTARPTVQTEAEAAELFEDQQRAKWAKIMAALIFIIAMILMPTFFVDDEQPHQNASSKIAQAKRAG